MCKILVGNKIDRAEDRKVTSKEATDFAKQYNMKYFEASARTNQGVTEMFEDLTQQVYEKR